MADSSQPDALLASVASSGPSPSSATAPSVAGLQGQQNQTALNALSSRLTLPNAAPAAFAAQQQAAVQAPFDLAAHVAQNQINSNGAFQAAMQQGVGNYRADMAAAMPEVNAYTNAQMAAAQGQAQSTALDNQLKQLQITAAMQQLTGNQTPGSQLTGQSATNAQNSLDSGVGTGKIGGSAIDPQTAQAFNTILTKDTAGNLPTALALVSQYSGGDPVRAQALQSLLGQQFNPVAGYSAPNLQNTTTPAVTGMDKAENPNAVLQANPVFSLPYAAGQASQGFLSKIKSLF